MKRTFTMALALALTLGTMAPAMAQDQFPDVPANHWAYEALEVLKRDGILVGYPDGKYRGTRLMTRYEAAVAIHAAYKRLLSMHEGLAEQVKALEGMIKGDGGDSAGMLKDMKAQLDSMKNWGDDIATLRKMVEEFEKELTGLGADVDKMKAQLSDLDARVTSLEKRMNVSITGDANLVVFAGNSMDNYLGMNKEGRIVGFNEKAGLPAVPGKYAAGVAGPVGLTNDLNIYHELALNLKNGNEKDAIKWNATIIFGNAFGNSGAGNGILADYVNVNNPTVGSANQANYTDNLSQDVAITDLAVTFDTSLAGVGFNAYIGRIAKKVGPYLMQRADNTEYFANERWDDGKYRLDGAHLAFKFGGVDLMVFGGRNSDRRTVNGLDLNGIALPPVINVNDGFPVGAKVDTTLGAQVGFNLGTFGRLNAAYLWHDTSSVTSATNPANRLSVFGADANLRFGQITVNGGYSQSVIQKGTSNIVNKANQAAFANASYDANNWGVMAEYRKIQRFFAAAGDWRRIGTFWNPTNIDTVTGAVWFRPAPAFKLFASGEFGKPIQAMTAAGGKEDIRSIIAGLDYNINDAWKATIKYEDVLIDDSGSANDIKQKWGSIGLGYNLGTNSMLNLAYEVGSVTNPVAWGQGGAGRYKGGFFVTQLTIKF